jgi:localization factor PodJL
MHNRPTQPGYTQSSRRSAGTTLEKLDDALSMLERRMGIESNADRGASASREIDQDISAIRARQEALAKAPPVRTNLTQAQPVSTVGHRNDHMLRDELARMRDTLNRELSTTIAGQFEEIREELRRLGTAGAGLSSDDLADGFNRLTRELGVVASRVENTDASSLRAEVEELKAHVTALAREDTLRDMADRWTVIEREIGDLPQTLGSRQDLMAIADRIAQIDHAMHGLPDSQAMNAMEAQVRALAEAVESLAAQNASISPEHLKTIEDRLDEISRAIIAVSVSAPPAELDPAPFERIEARLSSLARQFEERSDAPQSDAVERKLSEIGARLDTLQSATASLPSHETAFETVADRLEELAKRLDHAPVAGAELPGGVIESLNSRFEEIANRLDSHRSSAQEAETRMFESLDARMEELARRIEENERESGAVPSFDHMERRLEEIAQMLTSGDGYVPVDGTVAHDPAALQGLEAQIAALSERLSTAGATAGNPALDELAPRLVHISEQLVNGREEMIAAAREAAEEIASRMAPGASDSDRTVLSQLTDDLHGLEELARSADDRNVRTFEAIHDTLVKVADRIAGLEAGLAGQPALAAAAQPAPVQTAQAASAAAPVMPRAAMPEEDAPKTQTAEPQGKLAADEMAHVEDAPPVDFANSEHSTTDERRQLSPMEAAVFAARAAASDAPSDDQIPEEIEAEVSEKSGKKGFLSGIRNRLSRSSASTPIAESEEPEVFGKAEQSRREPAFADEPLEPGTGGPDLAAIMRRVRSERSGQPAEGDEQHAADDSGKSDFIAAARRAAKAAADEASVLDRKSMEAAGGKKKAGSSRRPLLLAVGAILLAIMAVPLVRNVLVSDSPPAAQLSGVTEEVAPEAIEETPVEPAETAETAVRVIEGSTENAPGPVPEEVDPAQTAAFSGPSEMQDVTEETSEMPVAPGDSAEMSDIQEPDAGFQALTLADVPESVGPIALREAAVEGDPLALFVIGDRLTGDGPGSPGSDAEAAAKWYEMAAELGFAPAQYRIGNFYENGIGTERDLNAAKTWYQLAAEQGNASAMHNLAVLFATEVDGKRDMASAARWFLEAADLGVRDSQVNLGILSARGEGLEQNLVESWKWLALAAKAGDRDAESKRDEVANFMRPDQLEMARGAAELWKPKTVNSAVNTFKVPDAWRTDAEVTATASPQPAASNLGQEEMKRAVRNIQAILNNHGYDAGPADGIMGTKTRDAIIEFQKANNLLPTGEVDKALVDALLELNKKS